MNAAPVPLVVVALLAAPLHAQSPALDTSAVVRVDGWAPSAAHQPLRLLQGRVPGAFVAAGGRVGADAVPLFHPEAVDAPTPLIVLDGAPVTAGALDLAPADIASIEVTRGAAAAAVYGARAGAGVIVITTRRPRQAGGSEYGMRVEAGSADLYGSLLRSRSTYALLDAAGSRFCVAAAGAPVCGVTIDWASEAARVNNAAGAPHPPAMLVPATTLGGSRALANTFAAQPWPGATFDPLAQITDNGTSVLAEADGSWVSGRVAARGSLTQLEEPALVRGLDPYRRRTGRLGLAARLGAGLSVTAHAALSRSTDYGRLAYDEGGALFRASMQAPGADLLARDTLGRPFERTDLGPAGIAHPNPLSDLYETREAAETDRRTIQATVGYRPAGRLEFDLSVTSDRLALASHYERATRNGFFGTVDQPATATITVVEGGGRFRADPLEGLQLVLSARARREEREQNSRWDYGGGSFASAGTRAKDASVSGRAEASYRGRWRLDATLRQDDLDAPAVPYDSPTSGGLTLGWRVGDEAWWPLDPALSDLVLSVSRGRAGGRAEVRLYDMESPPAGLAIFAPGVAGPVTGSDFGARFTLWSRVGVDLRYAVTREPDTWFPVPLPAQMGFAVQWQKAAILEGRVFEAGATISVVERRDVAWSLRLGYDRARSRFTRLLVPPFTYGLGNMFSARVGEELGTIYGRRFVTSCTDLPAAVAPRCGDGGEFQPNDDGYIVWVGTDGTGTPFTWRDGITHNLWGKQLAGAQAPWGVPLNWGAPIVVRDPACVATPSPTCASVAGRLGRALPDWQFSVGTTLRWRRFTVQALLQGSVGRDVWNQARQWAYLDLVHAETDQAGRTPETAKPVGYYWRASPADGPNGYGGLYDFLAPNNHFVESTSYARMRELAVTWDVGRLAGRGSWSVTFVARNLFTITNYRGLDPEVPFLGGETQMELNAVDGLAFPERRSVAVSVAARF